MKKLLIGAMMASLFMMGSDANAFSLFGKKNKATSNVSTSKSKSSTNLTKSASASNLGTKKVGVLSKLTGKASQQKTVNATIYSQEMGKYFEAPVAAICIQSGGLASFFSDELSNNFYVKNSERNAPDMNAKTNIQSAIKAFNNIYKYMRQILKNDTLLTKGDAEKTIKQLEDALLALVGERANGEKPSQFWKYFGNHIRYSLVVMRNSFNMLLYPEEYWNVGAMIFSANDGTRGANGRENEVKYHMGSLSYQDPKDAEISADSPVLSLRNGLTKLVLKLVEAEAGGEAARQLEKQDRKERLSRTSSIASSSRTLVNEYDDVARGREVSIDDDSDMSIQSEYGNGEIMDDDEAYHDAWEEDVTDPRPSARYR